MQKSRMLAGLSVLAGVALLASGTMAQDVIAKRKEAMKGVGGAAKASTEMVKGERPFDAKVAAENMTKIATMWPDFAKSFPKGTETGGETTAAAKIWTDFKDFDEKGQAMSKLAEKASTEAPKGLDAFKAAWGEVGKTCKGCHETYRIPKK